MISTFFVLVSPLLAWGMWYTLLSKQPFGGWRIDPDPRTPWSFLPIYESYRRWADRVCIASGIGFFLSGRWSPPGKLFLGATACLLTFTMVLMFFYERYMHNRFSEPGVTYYNTVEYSIVLALATAGTIDFLAAMTLMVAA